MMTEMKNECFLTAIYIIFDKHILTWFWNIANNVRSLLQIQYKFQIKKTLGF